MEIDVVNYVYSELANGIIIQAVKDYYSALVDYKMRADDYNACKVKSLEKFFKSKWYNTLTHVDGEYIINKIKSEVFK